jgi:hypothetical protein
MLQTIQEPHCMNCKVPWNNDIIVGNFTKTFFNTELRRHRERILFEREKALLPHTQQEIRHEHLTREMNALYHLALTYREQNRREEEAVYREKAQQIADELGVILAGATTRRPDQNANKPRPVCKCLDDNCRGFIMNNNWACGLCNKKVCKDCLKEKPHDTAHTCLQEDIETRRLLLNNTKPCPKCGAMINKVDGCDQMWCVMCHTTFNWRSGEIVEGHVHNPHYYEWLRRTGRDVPRAPGDQPPVCGGERVMPWVRDFRNRVAPRYPQADLEMLLRFHMLATHMREWEMPRLANRYNIQDNRALRRSFLLNNISEEDFKREMSMKERGRDRSMAIRNIMELFYNQLSESIVTIHQNLPEDLAPTFDEITNLANYCNECFRAVAKLYNVKPFAITADFRRIQQI